MNNSACAVLHGVYSCNQKSYTLYSRCEYKASMLDSVVLLMLCICTRDSIYKKTRTKQQCPHCWRRQFGGSLILFHELIRSDSRQDRKTGSLYFVHYQRTMDGWWTANRAQIQASYCIGIGILKHGKTFSQEATCQGTQ